MSTAPRADVLKLMDELSPTMKHEARERACNSTKTNILALHRRGEPSPFTISPGFIALEPRTVRVEAAPAAQLRARTSVPASIGQQ